jgi:hypothetical protein
MIQQAPGDLLEIEFEGKFYYVVVLTKIVMFGGNIIFAFHGDGSRRTAEALTETASGFNICSDLLLPKKHGAVRRLRRFQDISAFWRTHLVKLTNEWRKGHKAHEWYIYRVDDLQNHIEIRRSMPSRYAEAMDGGMYSFDLVASKILKGYTPEQNNFL